MDFREFTSSDQFDKTKVAQFVRLESIPGFALLQSEREYLELYRECLRKEAGTSTRTAGSIIDAYEEVKPKKRTKKQTKEETEEEPVSE